MLSPPVADPVENPSAVEEVGVDVATAVPVQESVFVSERASVGACPGAQESVNIGVRVPATVEDCDGVDAPRTVGAGVGVGALVIACVAVCDGGGGAKPTGQPVPKSWTDEMTDS